MFYLIGSGLKPKHLTIEAVETLSRSDKIYIDSYTSVFSEGSLGAVEELAGVKITVLQREDIEENYKQWLAESKEKNVALIVIGNPLMATTHVQLLLEARKLGIESRVVSGISIFDGALKSMLSPYRFGSIVSIPFWQKNYEPESFFDSIKKNFDNNLHSLCLLDIQKTAGGEKLMTPLEALQMLKRIAEKRGENWIFDVAVIVLGLVESEKQIIIHGKLNDLLKDKWLEKFVPASIVIAAKLNDKEKEALSELL